MSASDVPATRPACAEAGGCLVEHPVRVVDGVFHLPFNGGTAPLRQNGEPVSAFVPGWRATRLFTGFAPLFVLEFADEAGGIGIWFLDHRLDLVGHDPSSLPPEHRDMLRVRAVPLLREIAGGLLRSGSDGLTPPARALLRLDASFRTRLAHALAADGFERPLPVFLDTLGAEELPELWPDGTATPLLLSRDHLSAGLAVDWQDHLATALRVGTLRWPSPVDGTPLECDGSIVLDDFHFAYRFTDARHGLSFFVLVGDHRSEAGGLWVPSLGLMFCRDQRHAVLLRLAILRDLPLWLLLHALRWRDAAVPYFRAAKTGLANVLRSAPHVGHQLWNELSGIDTLVSRDPDAPVVHLVFGSPAAGPEVYGRIEQLFPALEGRVVRDGSGIPGMIAHAYREGLIVVRFGDDHVSRSLRERIAARAIQDAAGDPPGGPAAIPGPSIVFGLRVENRTLADLDGFLHRLVSAVDRRFPDLAIVFDGHNASRDAAAPRPIGSQGQHMARTPPHEVERGIVDRLRDAFPQRRDRIADTIMAPIATSIACAVRARCFVSIWGASLAKYRWIANKPGFVLTSAWNLRHRDDLDIYHAPRFTEDPAPMEFIDPVLVRDDPAAPQLVPIGGDNPGFSNFHLDEDASLDAILRFLDRHLAPD